MLVSWQMCLSQKNDTTQISYFGLTPWTISPRTFPLPCSVRVSVRSWVSSVRVGSVGFGLVELVLWLGLGLWFELGGKCQGGEMFRGNVRHSSLHLLFELRYSTQFVAGLNIAV